VKADSESFEVDVRLRGGTRPLQKKDNACISPKKLIHKQRTPLTEEGAEKVQQSAGWGGGQKAKENRARPAQTVKKGKGCQL